MYIIISLKDLSFQEIEKHPKKKLLSFPGII